MFYIGEGIEINYFRTGDKFNFDEFINTKRFTAKDTSLSYRQVNTLDEDNLLNQDRKNKNGWRKFSFKELVFILLVKELKKFGFEHHQLRELSNYFLNEEYAHLSDLAIGCVLGQIEITITVDSEGKVDIFDHNFYILIGTDCPHIKITLNDTVNELVIKIGKKPFPIKYSIKNAYFDTKVLPKEEELIKIIRDKSYSSITVKKRDGEISIIHAERTRANKNEPTEGELMSILRAKDFQDINIIKRDGKIVSYKVEETIKV